MTPPRRRPTATGTPPDLEGLAGPSGLERAARAAALGMLPTLPRGAPGTLERMAGTDPDPRARSAALGALARSAGRRRASRAWRRALADPDAAVRRRAAELAPAVGGTVRPLLGLLHDLDVTVVEAAAWALGEMGDATRRTRAVAALASVAVGHDDPLAREAAVAALGALGDPAGLPAVLVACRDRPAVRRRAVLALSPFAGPEVDAALDRAARDVDWQVRQAADELRGGPARPGC